jgi:site-specific DNA recombinase
MDANKNSTVILARVSSKSQEDEGYSLDSQLKLLQGYCISNNLSVVKVYKIAETASKQQSRKVFSELLTYMQSNNVYNLAVEKTDRLTRNLRDAVAIDDWLQADAGRMLHAVKENIKLHRESKSDVKFMWNIHLAVAKKYTDNLREEAMKGWAEKLAQGWMPSRPPIGYMTAIQDGKKIHTPDPKIAPFIINAFELYLKSEGTIESIWTFLKQSGITTYNGRPLTRSATHLLLQNSYYMGIIKFNHETYAGAHEPLVSKQLFKAVQNKMHNKKSSKRCRHDIPLKNILKCGHCGKVVTWEKHKGHYYGACQRDLVECKQNKYLREETAQQILVDKMADLISPSKAIIDWMISHLDTSFNESNNNIQEYKSTLMTRITRLEKMDEMLYDDKLVGDISRERYAAKHADILKQIEQLKDEALVAETTSVDRHKQAIDLIQLTQNAKDEFLNENLTNDAKRTILTELFESAVYEANSISVRYTSFVESIAKRSQESRQILKEDMMLNRTNKKDLTHRGHYVENYQLSLLRPIWQGHVESNHDLRFWRPLY